MQRHPNFDLWLHDDEELTALLGSPIMGRVTIHEWPLSCVQRLQCAAGPSYFYKAHVHSSIVLAAINGPTGYVHMELRDENVWVLPDGYRVIDWQRPIWGPVARFRDAGWQARSRSLRGNIRRGLPDNQLCGCHNAARRVIFVHQAE